MMGSQWDPGTAPDCPLFSKLFLLPLSHTLPGLIPRSWLLSWGNEKSLSYFQAITNPPKISISQFQMLHMSQKRARNPQLHKPGSWTARSYFISQSQLLETKLSSKEKCFHFAFAPKVLWFSETVISVHNFSSSYFWSKQKLLAHLKTRQANRTDICNVLYPLQTLLTNLDELLSCSLFTDERSHQLDWVLTGTHRRNDAVSYATETPAISCPREHISL